MKTKTLRRDKVNVITLGCSKNIVDSENLITQLRGNDFEVVHDSDQEDANVIIVNTCGFIDVAKEESINTILQYAELKKTGDWIPKRSVIFLAWDAEEYGLMGSTEFVEVN